MLHLGSAALTLYLVALALMGLLEALKMWPWLLLIVGPAILITVVSILE